MTDDDIVTILTGQTMLLDGSLGDATLSNDGVIEAPSGQANSLAGDIVGNGTIRLDAEAKLYLNAPVIDPRQTIRFDGPNALIVMEAGADTLPTIDGFESGDGIQLGRTALSVDTVLDDAGAATVTVVLFDGSMETFRFDGDYTGRSFYAEAQRMGFGPPILRVSEAVACFCPGTLIATATGPVAIETLAIGDLVRTHAGRLEPVIWIGRRSYDHRFAAGRMDLQPVRFRPGALGLDPSGAPSPGRDLLVSPRHAMLVGDVLVPAALLVNGVSVLQQDTGQDLHYVHVELDGHHLLLAEGAAAESFIDDDSRGMFHNIDEYRALYPGRTTPPAAWCVPRVEDGPRLVAARSRIDSLAGLDGDALTDPHPLYGCIDSIEAGRLRGWAWMPTIPEAAVCLEILIDGVKVGDVLADRYRADLAVNGIGSGCHAFDMVLADADPASIVTARRALDGMPLDAASGGMPVDAASWRHTA